MKSRRGTINKLCKYFGVLLVKPFSRVTEGPFFLHQFITDSRNSILTLYPDNTQQDHGQHRQGADVYHLPAEVMLQGTGREDGNSHRGEDGKIIHGLGLGALIGAIGLGKQGRATDEKEVPANPEQQQGRPEVSKAATEQVPQME